MNLIEQKSTVWGETPYTKEEAILWIERAGRVCYRSEDKIIDGSGITFVNNIIKRKHLSVIEHSNLVLRLKEKSEFPLVAIQAAKAVFDSDYFSFDIYKDRIYVAGNWRAWFEWYNRISPDYADIITLDNMFDVIVSESYEIVTDPEEIPNSLKVITAEFITDRAVTHELVRHRPASYSQESQRYVRYGDINFIKPSWFNKYDEDSYARETFECMCEEIEYAYNDLLKEGMKAEDARVILPNATATKIVMSATVNEWKHIFSLRLSKAAYPQIRNLLNPVYENFVMNKWIG